MTAAKTTRSKRRVASWPLSLAVTSAMALTIAACGSDDEAVTDDSAASGSDAEYAELCEAAEGDVNLYSHVTATEQIDAFVQAFEEQYPDINVSLTNKTGSAILETFLSEKRAGLNTADVIQYPGIAPFKFELQEEGFIEEYTPTSASLYPEEALVPGYGYPWLSYTMGALYNTDMVSEEEIELLQTYEGWADPTWKGRISAGSPGSASIQRALFYWVEQDEDLGEEWFRSFAENKPVPFNSVTPAAERVIAGEYAASFPQMSITAARAIPEGAPVAWVAPEYSVTNPALVGLASDAPHPNAAKCLIEYHLSEAGQRAMVEAIAADTLRDGLDISPVDSEDFEAPEELVVADEDAIAESGGDVVDLWNAVIGPGKE